jgi:hypothetical protein
MSKDQPIEAAGHPSDGLSEMETSLGRALALIHRILPRLDDPGRAGEVQAALQKAAACIESARQIHQHGQAPRPTAPAGAAEKRLEAETVAIISAAVSAMLERPFRMVSVKLVAAPVPHLNVWALEGRTQIFHSHKIR